MVIKFVRYRKQSLFIGLSGINVINLLTLLFAIANIRSHKFCSLSQTVVVYRPFRHKQLTVLPCSDGRGH